jgi:predicted nucleotidyltransferase
LTNDLTERVLAAVRHPSINEVTLIGSRARGEATPLSDWDFRIDTDDFDEAAKVLPQLTEVLKPLARLWDPLAEIATYMLILPGPTKVDFLFTDQPSEHLPPPVPGTDNLISIDAHFWDWSLWLTSKIASGKTELVEKELDKMTEHILRPMGVTKRPATLLEATDLYLNARIDQESRWGVQVPQQLGLEVRRVVEATTGPIA